jgi:geranylgeranyl diphosphate synthase, type II
MNVQQALQSLNQTIASLEYGQRPIELYEPIRYMMALGGKRLRPLLTLLSAGIFTDDWEKAIKPAISVEVFHNFTLMHDDIMDKAPLRRNQPTVHTKWNDNVAILSGDVMLVNAYQLLVDVEPRILRHVLMRFNRVAAQVCEGQQLDMNFEVMDQVSEAQYLEMVELKTAVLLGFSMELGGLIAGADEVDTRLLWNAGTHIGIGFQLKDDLLDVFGEQQKFGKQVGGDIIANKKTFLLIEAMEKAGKLERQQLDYWLAATEFDKTEKVKAITAIYNQLNVRQLTEARMDEYFSVGLASLKQLHVDESRKATLLHFVEQLIHRES